MTTREQALKFRESGKILAKQEDGQYEIRAGDIYEGKTVRGHTNLIIALRIIDDFMCYGHGDTVKKTPLEHFLRAIESGDLVLKYLDEIDVERIAMCQIALDAIANRVTFEKAVDMQLEEAERMSREGHCGISDQE